MTTNEKDPKDHFVQPLRCPRTANGNTKRVLVVYSLTGGAVTFVHACEHEGLVSGSLAPWAGSASRAWEPRLGEEIEVPAKVAKEYLERSRKLALRAIDEATKTILFNFDAESVGPASKRTKFTKGERISATDVVTRVAGQPATVVSFTYRGATCMVRAADITVLA